VTGEPGAVVVEVLSTEGCGSRLQARTVVERAAEALGVAVAITETLVRDQEAARLLRFPGSPTVRVNGVDLQPEAVTEAASFGLG
jgi:hypothetical protein